MGEGWEGVGLKVGVVCGGGATGLGPLPCFMS